MPAQHPADLPAAAESPDHLPAGAIAASIATVLVKEITSTARTAKSAACGPPATSPAAATSARAPTGGQSSRPIHRLITGLRPISRQRPAATAATRHAPSSSVAATEVTVMTASGHIPIRAAGLPPAASAAVDGALGGDRADRREPGESADAADGVCPCRRVSLFPGRRVSLFPSRRVSLFASRRVSLFPGRRVGCWRGTGRSLSRAIARGPATRRFFVRPDDVGQDQEVAAVVRNSGRPPGRPEWRGPLAGRKCRQTPGRGHRQQPAAHRDQAPGAVAWSAAEPGRRAQRQQQRDPGQRVRRDRAADRPAGQPAQGAPGPGGCRAAQGRQPQGGAAIVCPLPDAGAGHDLAVRRALQSRDDLVLPGARV